MVSVPDGSRKNFCFITLYFKNGSYLADQLCAFPAAVVNTADKRRYISGAGLGGEDSLPGGEYQGAIGTDAVVGKPFDGFYAILDHRHFHHDIGVDGRQFFTFFYNGLKPGSQYLGADIAVYYYFANGLI